MKNTISPIRAALATAITMLASASLFANEAPLPERVVSAGSCLLYTSPSPRDPKISRMPSSA